MTPALPPIPTAQKAADSIVAWRSIAPALSELLAAGLSPADAALRWGLELLKANQNGDAATVFRAAAALRPDDAALWTNLGVALDRTQESAPAAACLTRSLELQPHQPDTWLLLGIIRGKLGDLDGAEAAYRAALEQQPDSAAAWQCLALVKEQQRDYAAAIDCLGASIALGQNSAAIYANLGKLYYQTGRPEQAHDAYERAVRDEPGNRHYERMFRKARFLRDMMIGASVEGALGAYQPQPEPLGEEEEKERIAWLEAAAGMLSGWGYAEPAIRICQKQLEMQPGSASARYLLDVLGGAAHIIRAPEDYIVETFDTFAEGFDAQLVGVLGYDVPQKLCDLIRTALGVAAALTPAQPPLENALDAGCGTGLCGPLLRPLSRGLVGVDLSPRMLEMAERRGVYDELVRAELIDFLATRPGLFDAIVAADVLLYLGDLAPLFLQSARALRPGGLLALSTELLPEEGHEGFAVLPSGRFAHQTRYVLAMARKDFLLERCLETTLRLDARGRLTGNLFLFRRRPTSP